MLLRELLAYDDIVIQCHDNPDADAIASGYGLYLYLKERDKKPRFVYGGKNVIRKSNLVYMVRDLKIPIVHVEHLEAPELLVTVDCQYGEGNVTLFEAKNVAVIDHHRVSGDLPALHEVRTNLGSCSTLIWDMLSHEGFDINDNKLLATALYYGLYTDTSGLAEISHPLDRDLRDKAIFDTNIMNRFRNTNLSLEELETAGAALLRSDYNDDIRSAIVKSGPCDPNILGIISDLVLEVDAVDTCLVFCVLPGGVKFSVRSCVKEVQANDLAQEISKGIGTGGGHLMKAGGYIPMELMTVAYLDFCARNQLRPRMEKSDDGKQPIPSSSGVKAVLDERMKMYHKNCRIIYAGKEELEETNMEKYHMRPLPMGYVKGTELFPVGTPVIIRTLSGDKESVIKRNTIYMIGTKGEIIAEEEKVFKKTYRVYPNWRFHLKEAEYNPTFISKVDDYVVEPTPFSRVCVPKEAITIKAKPIEYRLKLFPEYDDSKYLIGEVGDYISYRGKDKRDIFMVEKEIFEKNYVHEGEKGKDQIDTVLFDLDGTLLDTLEDLMISTNHALGTKGMPICSLEQIRTYVGNGIRKLIERAVPDGTDNPDFEAVFAAFEEHYAEHCNDHTVTYQNVEFLLQELKARGVKVGIVSNKVDSAVKALAKMKFDGVVECAIGETEGLARKPAPDLVQKALKELGADSERTIYVGDSEVDIETAKNAGLSCVSVSWGFRDEAFLRKQGATTIIKRPLDLLTLI